LHVGSLSFLPEIHFKQTIMKALKEIQELYINKGANHLNDSDLLHLLGIKLANCDYRDLFHSTRESLQRKGMTPAAALKITALSEIAHRYITSVPKEQLSISSSNSAAKIIAPELKHLSHEECWVLYLNRANKLIAKERLSIGGVSATVVDVKIVLKRAIELLCSGMILVHNHPSGNAHPGESDRTQTRILKDAAALFDISLLDHIIIAGEKYYSFADEGVI